MNNIKAENVVKRFFFPIYQFPDKAMKGNAIYWGWYQNPKTEYSAPMRGQIFWGTEDFLARLREPLRGKDLVKEVPRAQRYVARPSLPEIFRGKKGRREKRNDKIIYRAHVEHGYRMGEIAEHLGVHYTSVSRAIRRVERQCSRGEM